MLLAKGNSMYISISLKISSYLNNFIRSSYLDYNEGEFIIREASCLFS